MPSVISRRQILIVSGVAALASLPVYGKAGQDTWLDSAHARELVGNTTPILDGIELHLPNVSDGGAFLPLRFSVEQPENDAVETVYVIAPDNPFPRVAMFRFTTHSGRTEIATRIRLDVSQTVIAVARMRSGAVRIAERPIRIASSGCIAAGEADWTGAMQTRLRVPDFEADVPVQITAQIKHPMQNGLAGSTAPRQIIERFEARFDGQLVLAATLGPSISTDPYLRFPFAPRTAGVLELEWREDTGRSAIERLDVQL